MRSLQVKLSRRETVLVVLAALALVLLVGLRYQQSTQATMLEDFSEKVQRAEAALDQARRSADKASLEVEKQKLEQEVAQMPPLRADGGDVTLKLWSWAGASNVKLNDFEYLAGVTRIGDVDLVVHNYTLKMQGEVTDLHKFTALTASSSYKPVIRGMSLKRSQESTVWDMDMQLVVYSQKQASGS